MSDLKLPVRVGVVGCGSISDVHLRSYTEIDGVELAAVVDINESMARSVAEKYACRFYTDYKAMIDNENIAVVDICTPSGLRRDIAVYAAQKKKHVISEKPLEVTVQRIDDILEAARINGVTVHGIFNRRYRDIYKWLKLFLDEGKLGRLTFCDVAMKWYRPPEYYKNSWRGTWALDGGGALMNQCIHYVDLMQLYMGMPSSILGSVGRILHHTIETEDTAAAILRYENGAMGMIQASTGHRPGFSARFSIHGENGGIIIEDDEIVDFKINDATEEDIAASEKYKKKPGRDAQSASTNIVSDNSTHRRQLEDILEAIGAGRESQVSGGEARKSVAIITGVYRSAKEHREITL